MPADRSHATPPAQGQLQWTDPVGAIAFAENLTPNAFSELPPMVDAPDVLFPPDDAPAPRRAAHSRKKPDNHIPRPPNAFILFRSSFIKSQHVSTEVETNHSTLSKIIGLTWQNLPGDERQLWHAKAKAALDEHKRRYPQYAFRPLHTKGRAPEKRRVREVGPKDLKRCAKIAELLVAGKKGAELDRAILEFDRHHVPEIVTRFEAPLTARMYRRAASVPPPEEHAPFLAPAPAPAPPARRPRAASSQPTRNPSPAPAPAPPSFDHFAFPPTPPSFDFPTLPFPAPAPFDARRLPALDTAFGPWSPGPATPGLDSPCSFADSPLAFADSPLAFADSFADSPCSFADAPSPAPPDFARPAPAAYAPSDYPQTEYAPVPYAPYAPAQYGAGAGAYDALCGVFGAAPRAPFDPVYDAAYGAPFADAGAGAAAYDGGADKPALAQLDRELSAFMAALPPYAL